MIELRRRLTIGLLFAARAWRKTSSQALSALNVSEACASPLYWVGRLGGGVRQGVLAEYVGIEGPSLVRLLDQLVAAGLMVRKDDPSDRRAKTIWLTPDGERLVSHIDEVLVDLRASTLQGVSAADIETTLRVFKAFGGSSPTYKPVGEAEAVT